MNTQQPRFGLIAGPTVARALAGREASIIDLVGQTYVAHARGRSSNPPSGFLRFADRPGSRIIALPASLLDEPRVDGIKWIASYPTNHDLGLPRASSVMILNDPVTGFPYACLEAAQISATRTAASAALAWRELRAPGRTGDSLGIIGSGPIAATTVRFLLAAGMEPARVSVFDLDHERSKGFAERLREVLPDAQVEAAASAEDAVRAHDTVLLATTAGVPHVHDATWFDHRPLVLHLSLRDLDPSIVLGSLNVVDDATHATSSQTSLHLASDDAGIDALDIVTIADVMTGEAGATTDRTIVFAPFGMGILDLAVARFVHEQARDDGDVVTVPDFFDGAQDLDRLAPS